MREQNINANDKYFNTFWSHYQISTVKTSLDVAEKYTDPQLLC